MYNFVSEYIHDYGTVPKSIVTSTGTNSHPFSYNLFVILKRDNVTLFYSVLWIWIDFNPALALAF
jgi:hypothetical protein